MDNVNIPEVQSPVVETTTEVVKSKPKLGFLKILIPLVFLCLIVAGVWGWYRVSSFKPYRVMVSNVSPGSATVSWITEEPTPGMVIYQDKEFKLPFMFDIGELNKAYDDRDYTNAELKEAEENAEAVLEDSGSQVDAEDIFTEIVVTDIGKYYVHHVTVRGLEPSKNYYFMIGDGNVFRRIETENTKEVSFKTAKEIEEVKTPDPAYGVLRYYRGEEEGYERPKDTIVYAVVSEEIQGVESAVISCLTNEEGGWYLDLMNAYMEDGTTFWNNIKDYEATYIVFNLTIENTWDGRWSTEVGYYNMKPANAIDMRMDDKLDENLKYEGVSFEKEREVSNLGGLVKDIYAVREEDGPEVTPGNPAPDPGNAGLLEDITVLTDEQKQLCINYVYKADVEVFSSGGALESKQTKAEGISEEECKTIVEGYPENENPYGSCENDICGEKFVCGWVNSAPCDCTCSGGTGSINPGQMCACGSDGLPYGVGESQFGKSFAEMMKEAGACQDPTKGKHCYSITSGCWHFAGVDTKSGDKCVYDEKVGMYRWIKGNMPQGMDEGLSWPGGSPIVSPVTSGQSYPVFQYSGVSSSLAGTKCTEAVGGDSITTSEGTRLMCIPNVGMEFGTERTHLWTGIGLLAGIVGATVLTGGAALPVIAAGAAAGVAGSFLGSINVEKTWVEIKEDEYVNYQIAQLGIPLAKAAEGKDCKAGGDIIGCYCSSKTSGKEGVIQNGEKCGKATPFITTEFYDKSSGYNNWIKGIFAEDSSSTSWYIINPDEDILEQVGTGLHVFNVGNDYYLVLLTEFTNEVYIDTNNNGQIDAGDINVSRDFETIEVITLRRTYQYNLKKGFNFVSFPFINEESKLNKASGLIKHLNERTVDSVSSISKLENGRWISIGADAGSFDQNDFRILPGEGYLLNIKNDIRFTLYGKEIKYEQLGDSAPILLIPGWNLMGIYGSKTKTYTAKSMLEDINSYKGISFEAVNVTRWEEEKGAYEGYQIEEEDAFGFDFPIERQRGYFVKVLKGQGNWHPGIR